MPTIVNEHSRRIDAGADDIGALLDTLGTPHDEFWRTSAAEPVAFDDGLEVGSRGGHGPVRYRFVDTVPGRSIVMEFEPGIGLTGQHRFDVEPIDAATSVLRHTLRATTHGAARLSWPLLIRPIHDTVVEDVFDHVEERLTGRHNRPQTAPPWVRFVARRLLVRVVGACDEAPSALLASVSATPDAVDCWTTPQLPGDPDSPMTWAENLFGRPSLLLRLRDTVVRPLGLEATSHLDRPATGFPVVASTTDEVVLGVDDTHLDFRVSVAVRQRQLHLTTTVDVHNRLGRAYWAVVRRAHPFVVRRMLRRHPVPNRS